MPPKRKRGGASSSKALTVKIPEPNYDYIVKDRKYYDEKGKGFYPGLHKFDKTVEADYYMDKPTVDDEMLKIRKMDFQNRFPYDIYWDKIAEPDYLVDLKNTRQKLLDEQRNAEKINHRLLMGKIFPNLPPEINDNIRQYYTKPKKYKRNFNEPIEYSTINEYEDPYPFNEYEGVRRPV